MTLSQKYDHKPPAEWGPLFQRILQNKIHDWYRRQNVRQKWRQLLPFANGYEPANDPIENAPELKNTKPDDKLTQSRAMQTLNDAVQNLPRRQQQAFLLRTWEGLNVAETAAAMNCSQGSVKTHYSRAIHQLRVLLERSRRLHTTFQNLSDDLTDLMVEGYKVRRVSAFGSYDVNTGDFRAKGIKIKLQLTSSPCVACNSSCFSCDAVDQTNIK